VAHKRRRLATLKGQSNPESHRRTAGEKGIPAAEFYEKLDLLVKASALARVGGKLPEKFYKDGFTFLKAGKGYVVVKGAKPGP
jgi:hypothetical protein